MNAHEKLAQLRAERCGHHDRIDELVLAIRTDEAAYNQRQAERQNEINAASSRIGEIKNECAALESLGEPHLVQPQAVAA